MKARTQTRNVKIGNISIGKSDKILIQSMCNIKTEKVDEVIKQINECALLGADLMRVSVLDMKDAEAIREIKKGIIIPLVADIHFDYQLALKAIECGVDKIRINPGNIGDIEKIKKVVEAAKEKGVSIRVGVNSGSLDKDIHDYSHKFTHETLVNSAKKHVKILEDLGFYNIVISLKGSNVIETIKAYELASEIFDYPLHLGITEAGPRDVSLIRSSAGLSPLLLNGIGNTIRISITDDPIQEIKAAKRLLTDLGLYKGPSIISCPGCGRTQVDIIDLANRVSDYLETIKKEIKVAVMGCVVNGPGEAKNADLCLAAGKGSYLLFKNGQLIKTVKEADAFDDLIEEINNF
jgi:(E)-4-hydroxy-3-methylbut-2-enyl-diphosphate synthase